MTRDDLFAVNAGIVKNLIEAIALNCPKVGALSQIKQLQHAGRVCVDLIEANGVAIAKPFYCGIG